MGVIKKTDLADCEGGGGKPHIVRDGFTTHIEIETNSVTEVMYHTNIAGPHLSTEY